ncbi:tyrosine-type recombinase/integrase [Clostridium chromiireducens]|jgi:Site-specific recombinase XerD|uniref:Tyrosine-type recombinase/integrase n=1 Tax=Clostridium chromiireducens TaxID=225345 RepID=A0A964W1U5_9CLOT|nr:tyrosine-type recombinase/integrase [Clostridium chromiireducens]MVX63624.1 tyrosine-type recombinase/integrase [Clostridium chromiireducens]
MYDFIDSYIKDKKITHILNNHIYGFIHYLKKTSRLKGEEKEINRKTLYLHIKYVELFDKFLYYSYPSMKLDEINENTINEYKQFCLRGLKNNNKTLNKKLNVLNKFFGYLTKYKNLYSYNIMLNVEYEKNEEEHKPTIFTTSNLKLLFDTMRDYIYGQRDIVISKLILETGMLTRNILDIKIDQLSKTDKTIIMKSKSNMPTLYKLSNTLYEELNDYLKLRDLLDVNCSPYLFLSKRGNKYSIRSYQLFFAEAIRRCDFASTYTPRHLRSTFMYNISKLVSEERLKEITSQNKVKHYYELNDNPLRNIK